MQKIERYEKWKEGQYNLFVLKKNMKKKVLGLSLLGLLLLTGCSSESKDTGAEEWNNNLNKVNASTVTEEKASDTSLITVMTEHGDVRYLNILGCNLVIPEETFITTSHAYEEDGVLKEDYYISNETFDNAVAGGIITEEGQLVDKGVINKVEYEVVHDDGSYNVAVEVTSVDDGELYLNYEDQLQDIKSNAGHFEILEETTDAVRLAVDDGTYQILYGLGESYVITITYYGDFVEDMNIEQIMSVVRLKY